MRQALLGKLISTYIATFAIMIYAPVYGGLLGTSRYALDNLTSWFFLVAMIAFPVILLYGSMVSLMLDHYLAKWISGRAVALTLSGALHVVFGALFAVVVQWEYLLFALIGAAVAFVYFLADLLFKAVWVSKYRTACLIAILSAPILAIAVAMWSAAPSADSLAAAFYR